MSFYMGCFWNGVDVGFGWVAFAHGATRQHGSCLDISPRNAYALHDDLSTPMTAQNPALVPRLNGSLCSHEM
ncbi:hypothetical protein SODALDRAFT_363199 [Sodiomyces alkalinus F11]|uniref:Uncharacterized protein n=1 Tax=Sodiomyces alkalinus (strain CBS 110278 / VKM F-3762 / F11) TaxID=1314773 RepID=A0A3N2PLM2_SODAK|nr:hypothetical protein SODALDRAFT_363199 [Sodiomyces alkalinus F11]ROT35379.1 hypothetical protein SODALDRAFT_363199 [Sodiomyces alkalinus F11]